MSTPSTTIIKNLVLDWATNEKKEVTIAKFYRHWDGYPSGHGADIASALVDAALTKPEKYMFCDEEYVLAILNNRNWCQHFFKELCKKNIDIEFVDADDKIYADYTYVITGEYANYGGKLSIDAEDYLNGINIKVYRGDEGENLLFDGNASRYVEWGAL